MEQLIQIHPADNVAVALTELEAGRAVPVGGARVTPNEAIARGHKVALRPIAEGDAVVKYGCPIGTATRSIAPGDWVHTHNVKTGLTESADYRYDAAGRALPERAPATFRGYIRPDGRAAIRNEIWILPTVGCVNDVCKRLAERTRARAQDAGLDGVYAFPHPYGCSQMGDDMDATRRVLAALARHPNAGGVLLVGLGCENNTMQGMMEALGDADRARMRFMVCQEERDELSTGERLIDELVDCAKDDRREDIPASELVIGLKCGGSDGLSGITANAVVGAFSDRMIEMGASTILTEVPEMFGAEGLLFNRCRSQAVFSAAVKMVEDFKDYYVRHGQVVYENPSPGNKQGGITTLEDKSLGCVQKGGSAPIVDVLGYGERVREKGLTLLSGPGNDLVSTTALTAAGAHLILFTTGRGTPFGAPAVTLKISSNTELMEKKPNWIDFDAGVVAAGRPIHQVAQDLVDTVLMVASGDALARAEQNGYREIAIFKNGVTL